MTAPPVADGGAPVARRVEHVMGIPISLALRGRHTRDPAADAAWAAVLASLREADRVFSTYRADSVVTAIRRGELAPADAPAEVHEVLAIGARVERAPTARSRCGAPELDPSGVVKGWAVERAAVVLRALPRHRSACPPAATWSAGRCRRSPGGSGSRTRPTRPACSPSSRCVTARWPPRVPRTAARTSSTPAPATRHPPSRQVTVTAASLTRADVDATAAYALGARAAEWLGQRVGRSGLVVWTDGTTTTVSGVPG